MAGFSLAAGGVTWALGSSVQARARMEPYRERLMTFGMVLVAASIAGAPAVLIDAVPVWTLAVVWAFGCFGMGLVIASTSVLLLHLSAPEEAGANSASLQISDGLSNVLLLAGGVRLSPRWVGDGGSCLRRSGRGFPSGRLRRRVSAYGGGGVGGGLGDYAVAGGEVVPQWPHPWYRGGMAMNLRLRDDQQEALKLRAEEEGRSMHAIVLQAIDRYLEQEADRNTVRRLGAKYAAGHADLLRRLGE